MTVVKLGLRFDKVVIRVLGKLKAFVRESVPKGKVVVITISAPIRLPAKTERALEEKIKDCLESRSQRREQKAIIYKNKVHIRIINRSSSRVPQFIGFVHSSNTNSKLILDYTTKWVSSKDE